MIQQAEKDGRLIKGKSVVIEPSEYLYKRQNYKSANGCPLQQAETLE
jgi:hypothetical protein